LQLYEGGGQTYFIYLYWYEKSKAYKLSYSLIIGGALANITDRIKYGAVFDFLDFHINDYHWPAFNFADASITCGAVVLIYLTIFEKHETKKS
jgi:signal peptidase II